ncbi:hypothetical protein J1779_15150 [Rahnella sp. FC061912-K]|uniref:hypothetical protein n=1 Tax=Rahnella rivi TaxID=2816249 RepID=UPI001C279D01|nr:hypothetical protein [Rahnella rivi]MBU9831272.1 hypothetical protein [Rahnella rivi]
MPTVPVPRYEQQSVDRPGPVNVANIQQRSNGLDAIADFGNNLSNVIVQEKVKYDDGIFQDAVLKLNAGMQGIQTAQNQLEGNNALGSAPKAVGQYHELAGELSATIPANRQRDWQRQMESGAIQLSGAAERHEYGQMQQYRAGQQQAIVETGVTSAASLYSDPAAYQMNNARTKNSIETYGMAQGWSPEQIQAEQSKFTQRAALGAANAQLGSDYMSVITQNGEPADVGGTTRVSSTQVVDGTRGIRNNNPGNIEFNDNNSWQGQTGSDGRFAKFETPEHGIRALGRNLLSYGKQGIDTPAEIIGRWAPPGKDGKENDTQAYIKSVCAQLGVKADQPLDLTNADTLANLCNAIMKQENGKVPYSAEQVNKGVQAALGFSQLDTVARVTKTPYFNELDASTQATVIRQADALRKQQQAQYRTQLDDTVRDASAAYMRGVEYPNMPGQADFVSAYGYREGVQRYQDLENQRVAGQYIGAFRTLPTDSITAAVKSLTPEVGDGDGYASRANAYDHVKSAAAAVIQKRQSDPYGSAIDLGAYKPLNTSNPDDVSTELKSRFANSGDLKALGINAPLLSQQEAAGFTQIIRGTTNVDQTISMLQSMGQNLPAGAVRQVAGAVAPNSAAVAYSAILLGKPDNQYDNRAGSIAYSDFIAYKPTMDKYDASKTILLGDQLVNPTEEMKKSGISPVSLPSDDKLTRKFESEVGDAFANNPQARQMAFSVFKSAYAGIVYRSGDASDASTTTVNSDAAEKAALMATGGVYQGFQGGDVVMPFGMDKSTFKDRYTVAAQEALKDAGLNPGGQSNFTPVNVGSGQYRLLAGSGRWAVDPRTGKEVTVTVRAN